MSEDYQAIRQQALNLLARREHSEKELARKLNARFERTDLISEVLEQLKQERLQSDHRFADAYIHHRIDKGYGPLRISQELKDKGVSEELVEELLFNREVDWIECVCRVREKKFGQARPGSYRDQAKQSRFLQYRGFPADLIRSLFDRRR